MDILEILNKNFPNAVGALVSGSSITNNYSRSMSDVDVLVFDESCGAVSPFGYFENGTMYDFTLIPINNIDNIIRDEQFDQRGILLTMIAKGNIIKDSPTRLVAKIKLKAENLFTDGIHNNRQNFNALYKGLLKIRKEFSKIPLPHQRIFLVNEFFYIVTQMELIKTANWRMTGRHKADYLFQNQEAFFLKIHTLVLGGNDCNDPDGFGEIGLFIDDYLSAKSNVNQNRVFNNRVLIIDFEYENITMEHFVNFGLPKLMSSQVTSKNFLYFYMSDRRMNRIYKNKLSICFQVDQNIDPSYFERDVLRELRRIIAYEIQAKYRYNLTPTAERNEALAANSFLYELSGVFSEISNAMTQIILDAGKFDVKRHLVISLIVISYIAEVLNIKREELLNILFFISDRYIINRQEQIQVKPVNFLDYKKSKYQLFHQYYEQDKAIFTEAIQKGKLLHGLDENMEGKFYKKIIEALKLILTAELINRPVLFEEMGITAERVLEFIDKKNINNCLIFIFLFEHLQPLFLLNADQTSLALVILSEINRLDDKNHKLD